MDDDKLISLDVTTSIWENFYMVAPLIMVGTREEAGYNLAPKHMALPLGLGAYYGFISTPEHATYHNIKREGFFTVSYPKAAQVVLASLSALPRTGGKEGRKEIIDMLPTFKAELGDALFLKDAYLFLECRLDRIIDDFGKHSLIAGQILSVKVDADYLRVSEMDEQEMLQKAPLPAYLHPSRFATIRQSVAFPFPRDFNR